MNKVPKVQKALKVRANRKRFNTGTKAIRSEIKRADRINKEQAKAIRRQSKANLIRAKRETGLEKARLKTSLAKHTIWATQVGNIAGKGADIVNQGIVNSSQNVNGGLTGTSSSREEEDQEGYPGGGKAYKR